MDKLTNKYGILTGKESPITDLGNNVTTKTRTWYG